MASFGRISITILKGKDLVGLNPGRTSNPFVKVVIGSESFCTNVVQKTINPIWYSEEGSEGKNNEAHHLFQPCPLPTIVTFSVYNKLVYLDEDEFMGTSTMTIFPPSSSAVATETRKVLALTHGGVVKLAAKAKGGCGVLEVKYSIIDSDNSTQPSSSDGDTFAISASSIRPITADRAVASSTTTLDGGIPDFLRDAPTPNPKRSSVNKNNINDEDDDDDRPPWELPDTSKNDKTFSSEIEMKQQLRNKKNSGDNKIISFVSICGGNVASPTLNVNSNTTGSNTSSYNDSSNNNNMQSNVTPSSVSSTISLDQSNLQQKEQFLMNNDNNNINNYNVTSNIIGLENKENSFNQSEINNNNNNVNVISAITSTSSSAMSNSNSGFIGNCINGNLNNDFNNKVKNNDSLSNSQLQLQQLLQPELQLQCAADASGDIDKKDYIKDKNNNDLIEIGSSRTSSCDYSNDSFNSSPTSSVIGSVCNRQKDEVSHGSKENIDNLDKSKNPMVIALNRIVPSLGASLTNAAKAAAAATATTTGSTETDVVANNLKSSNGNNNYNIHKKSSVLTHKTSSSSSISSSNKVIMSAAAKSEAAKIKKNANINIINKRVISPPKSISSKSINAAVNNSPRNSTSTEFNNKIKGNAPKIQSASFNKERSINSSARSISPAGKSGGRSSSKNVNFSNNNYGVPRKCSSQRQCTVGVSTSASAVITPTTNVIISVTKKNPSILNLICGKQLLDAAIIGNAAVFSQLFSELRQQNNYVPQHVQKLLTSVTDYAGRNPLHLAAWYGHVDVLEVLLQVHHSSDQQNAFAVAAANAAATSVTKNGGNNLLHCAAYGGNARVVEWLLLVIAQQQQQKAYNNYVNNNIMQIQLQHLLTGCNARGLTPYQAAVEAGNVDCAKVLATATSTNLNNNINSSAIMRTASTSPTLGSGTNHNNHVNKSSIITSIL